MCEDQFRLYDLLLHLLQAEAQWLDFHGSKMLEDTPGVRQKLLKTGEASFVFIRALNQAVFTKIEHYSHPFLELRWIDLALIFP